LRQKLGRISRQISGGEKKQKTRRVSATGKGMKVKPKKVIIRVVVVNWLSNLEPVSTICWFIVCLISISIWKQIHTKSGQLTIHKTIF
jgi:hypothetical protein